MDAIDRVLALTLEVEQNGEFRPGETETLFEKSDPDYLKLTKGILVYTIETMDWMDDHREEFIILNVMLDAAEILDFHSWFMADKLRRIELAVERDTALEADCTGLVGLISSSLNKSLKAWTVLFENMPDSQDDVLELALMLSFFREELERLIFPLEMYIPPQNDEG